MSVKTEVGGRGLACREEDGSVDMTWSLMRVYQALLYLRGLRFDAPLPWTDKSVYDWVRTTIPNGIVIDAMAPYSHSCVNCSGPITLVVLGASQRVEDQNQSITDTPYITIVHETRHAAGWSHGCDNGTRDQALSQMGSFGVSYWLLRWIATHSQEPELVRQKAAVSAQLLLRDGFCCECKGTSVRNWFLAPPSTPGRQRCSPV